MVLLTAATASDVSDMTTQIADTIASTTEENAKQVNIFLQYMEERIPDAIGFGLKVVFALLIFLIGARVIKWCRKLLRASMERTNVELGVMQFVDSIAKYGLYAALLILIARSFGVDSASVAALVASAGVAVGLALQGSFSNIAGGILLMVLKPFSVGDYIICGSYEGTITEIQIYYSKMLTVDNRAVIIPNGELSGNSLVNVTKEEERRLDLTIGVSYDADLKLAKETLWQVLRDDADVLDHRENLVVVEELGESAVVLGVKAWVPTSRFLTAKWRLLEQMKLALDRQGIEIPYQRTEVFVRNKPEDAGQKEEKASVTDADAQGKV